VGRDLEMTMPPIKYEIKPGMWVGVGDRVWTIYGNPRQGIITGFTGNVDEDQWFSVEVTHTMDYGSGNTRQSVMDYSLDLVFQSEKDAWHYKAKELHHRLNDLHHQAGLVEKEIQEIAEKWPLGA